VAIGIVRFLFLALWQPKDESATEAMLKDPWFLFDLGAAVGDTAVRHLRIAALLDLLRLHRGAERTRDSLCC